MELSSLKIKKVLIFCKKSFSCISGKGTFLKNLCIFQEGTSKLKKQKNAL